MTLFLSFAVPTKRGIFGAIEGELVRFIPCIKLNLRLCLRYLLPKDIRGYTSRKILGVYILLNDKNLSALY